MKNLLNPRFKVIAEYPNTIFKKDDILERIKYKDTDINISELLTNSKRCGINKLSGLHFSDLEKYPHLFKKLNWWDERKQDELPTYLKSETQVVKPEWELIEWQGRQYWRANTNEKLFGSHYKLESFTPSTKEEYEQSLS